MKQTKRGKLMQTYFKFTYSTDAIALTTLQHLGDIKRNKFAKFRNVLDNNIFMFSHTQSNYKTPIRYKDAVV